MPGKVVLRDYDFERPMLDLTVTAEDGKGEEVGEEVYEYPGGYTDPEHGKRLARIRLEELRFPQETWSGRGRTLALAAGSTFEVTRHPQLDWNQKLLAVRVAHEGRREEVAVATHCETLFFANRGEPPVPAAAQDRPARDLRLPAGDGGGPGGGGDPHRPARAREARLQLEHRHERAGEVGLGACDAVAGGPGLRDVLPAAHRAGGAGELPGRRPGAAGGHRRGVQRGAPDGVGAAEGQDAEHDPDVKGMPRREPLA